MANVRPTVDEILDRTLHELDAVRNWLTKAASRLPRLDSRPIDPPLTHAQSHARAVTVGAIDDAQAAINRATEALSQALRAEDPSRP